MYKEQCLDLFFLVLGFYLSTKEAFKKLFVVGIGLLDNVSLNQRTNLEERIRLPPEGQL